MKTLSAEQHNKGWVSRLQQRWGVKSALQVFLILLVFACTGFTVLFIKKPIFNLLGIYDQTGWVKGVLYLVAILPMYQVLLLIYGFIFGQFKFFWEFEKKMFRRMIGKK